MTGRELVDVLRANVVVVAVLMVLTLAAATALSLSRPDLYAARVIVAVGTMNPSLDLRNAYYSQRLVSQNYNPYADYFAVLAREGEARAPMPGHGSDELRSTTVVGIRSITVEVVGLSPDPGRAAGVAKVAADSFVDHLNAVTLSSIPRGTRLPMAQAQVEQRVAVPASPSAPNRALDAVVGVVAAAMVGVTGGLVAQGWANRGRARRECRAHVR